MIEIVNGIEIKNNLNGAAIRRAADRKIRSQKLIDTLREAKQDNPDITVTELNYLALGFKEAAKKG